MLLPSVLLVLASAARFSLGAGGESDVHDRVREYEPSHIEMTLHTLHTLHTVYTVYSYTSPSSLERDLYVGRQRTSLQYQ